MLSKKMDRRTYVKYMASAAGGAAIGGGGTAAYYTSLPPVTVPPVTTTQIVTQQIPTVETAVQKIYMCLNAIMRIANNAWIFSPPADMPATVDVPFPFVLVQTKNGNILVDTGMHNDIVLNVNKEAETRGFVKFGPEGTIENNLKQIGLTIKDISMIILTHPHFDHAGGLHQFKDMKIPFLIQRRDVEANLLGLWQTVGSTRDFIQSTNWHPIDTNYVEVMPGLELIWTGGHSPGHQIVKATLPTGKIFYILGDLYHLPEQYDAELTGRLIYNTREWTAAMKMLKFLVTSSKAEAVCCHDYKAKWYKGTAGWPQAPALLA